MKVQIVDYKLFDYESSFLADEIMSLGGVIKNTLMGGSALEVDNVSMDRLLKLTYAKGILGRNELIHTHQYLRETAHGASRTQSRRYGPHGLHEYKGRFNPQTPRSLVLSKFKQGDVILDPFSGSGTTLIEARGLGVKAVGVELNIMAHMIAKAKIYYEELASMPTFRIASKHAPYFEGDQREYLEKWFPENQLKDLEAILVALEQLPEKPKVIAQIILSNLLREHSLQEPRDLRIRRRESVPEGLSLRKSFEESYAHHRTKHERWVSSFHSLEPITAHNADSRYLHKHLKDKVNGTVTSPPYASALPYVDTYRLSMVALGLISPSEILTSEKALIGARDISSADREAYEAQMQGLPEMYGSVVQHIHNVVHADPGAGFRKKAVPFALSKYGIAMQDVLKSLYKVEEVGANNYWVIGSNRVRLGSEWYTIKTPELVGDLARNVGFKNVIVQPIQAYARFNIHSKNSTNEESILQFTR